MLTRSPASLPGQSGDRSSPCSRQHVEMDRVAGLHVRPKTALPSRAATALKPQIEPLASISVTAWATLSIKVAKVAGNASHSGMRRRMLRFSGLGWSVCHRSGYWANAVSYWLKATSVEYADCCRLSNGGNPQRCALFQ